MPTNPLKGDPTRTKTLRRKFESRLRKGFNRLAREIQILIVDLDAFGLGEPTPLFKKLIANVGQREWAFLTDEAKLEEFEKWIQQQTGLHIVPEDDRFWEDFVEEGYRKGAGRAFQDSKKREIAAQVTAEGQQFLAGRKTQFLIGMLGAPETVEKVKLLASRVLSDLKGVTTAMATQLRGILADGLVQGLNPRAIAREIADTVFGRQRAQRGARKGILARATRIARTEIIRAHAEGQLDSLERLGVEEVGVAVEWETANDGRVCPRCNALEGIVIKVEESPGLIPVHPNCRCSFIPANVGESTRGQVRSKSGISSRIKRSLKAGDSPALRRKRISKRRPKSVLSN